MKRKKKDDNNEDNIHYELYDKIEDENEKNLMNLS